MNQHVAIPELFFYSVKLIRLTPKAFELTNRTAVRVKSKSDLLTDKSKLINGLINTSGDQLAHPLMMAPPAVGN